MLKSKIAFENGLNYDIEKHGEVTNINLPFSDSFSAFAEGEMASSMMEHYIFEHGSSHPKVIINTTKGVIFCTDDCHEPSYRDLLEL